MKRNDASPYDRELLMRGAIVTGAASGIGAAISEALVKAGFSVILFDVTPAKQTLEKLLAIRPRSALIHQGDARKVDDIRAAIKAVNDHFAPFKALINCAGVGDVAGYPFSQTPAESQRIIDINFTALVHFTSEACQAMRNAGHGGAVVNLASSSGTVPIAFLPVYAASKAAVIHLTRSLAFVKDTDNIRVSALAPSFIDTPMVQQIEPSMREELVRSTGGFIPMQQVVQVLMRLATDEEQPGGLVLKMVPGKVFPWPTKPGTPPAARL